MGDETARKQTTFQKLILPRRLISEDRQKLTARMEEHGYGPNNGYEDDFIDDMVEVFKPWLK